RRACPAIGALTIARITFHHPNRQRVDANSAGWPRTPTHALRTSAMRRVHPKIEEAVETLDLNPVTRRRLLAGSGLVSASLAASALLTACSEKQQRQARGAGNFPKTPRWKFVFVCHVTAHPFFTPTQYGIQDACALLNCDYQWTGSQNAVVAEMVNATNAATSAKANGIALAVTDARAFTDPVAKALDAGIPVVSYNADGEPTNPGTARLAYIG